MNNDLALFFGRFHPLLVHLPIGLLVLLGWLELISRWPRFRHANRGVGLVLAIAVPLSVGTAVCGWLLSWEGGYDARLLQLHKWTGIGTAAATILVTLLYWLDLQTLYRFTLLGALGLLLVSSHYGGSLTHGRGYLVQYAPEPLRQALGLPPKGKARQPIPVVPASENDKGEQPAEPIFTSLVHPILEDKCVACHGPEKTKGGLRLDSFDSLMEGGDSGATVVVGKSGESELVRRLLLPLDDDEHMPPDGKPQLSADDIALIRWWIDGGADAQITVADVKQTPILSRILGDRLGSGQTSPAAVPAQMSSATPTGAAAPGTQQEVAPAVAELSRDLGLPLTFLGENDQWLQANAGVLGSDFGDAQLSRLTKVGKNLRWLDLSGTGVTDQGLTNLSGMPNLSRLHLQRTKVTDDGLKAIAGLQNLEYLNLYGTAVTDDGLDVLGTLSNLRQLYLWQTKVTPERAKAFADARIDHEQIKTWEKEIEALQARIRAQHTTVDVGTSLKSAALTQVAAAQSPINTDCPVSGKPVDITRTLTYAGKLIGFCCDACKTKFEADPKPFLEKLKLTPDAPSSSSR